MKEAGFSALSHIPFVLDGQWRYEDSASWYLRDRAMLAFSPGTDSGTAQASGRYPTRKSLEAFGRALTNFLEWCEARRFDWRKVEYTKHLINGYQAEMQRGSWSASGRKLSARTINGRVGEACHFLDWASQRALREAFKIITVTKNVSLPTHRNSRGHEAVQKEVRAGRVRPDPAKLRLPTDVEIEVWHRSVRIESGYTKALMCELILKTAIRREETCQWRIDTLPLDRKDWLVRGESVTVTIEYGTKGAKTYEDDDLEEGGERGPARSIVMPLSLAEKLAHYREYMRPGNRSTFVRGASNDAERRARRRTPNNLLFLSDTTGRPVKASRLYEAWTGASRRPFAGWSPHGGRHYWACKTLIAAIERHRRTAGANAPAVSLSPTWITGCANDALLLEIKPQLGHIDPATTELYIKWVTQTFSQAELHDAHLADLEGVAITELEGVING